MTTYPVYLNGSRVCTINYAQIEKIAQDHYSTGGDIDSFIDKYKVWCEYDVTGKKLISLHFVEEHHVTWFLMQLGC